MKLSFKILICFLTILKCSSAMTILCRYLNYIDNYNCEVRNKQIFTGDRVSIEKAVGQHIEGKTNDDVQSIEIINACNLTYFPSNINEVFKNLFKIAITYTSLTEITSNDLKVFPKLKVLYFGWNKIEDIREDTFNFNPKLEEIYLEGNKISHIDSKSFSDLKFLKVLDLEENICRFQRQFEVLEIVRKIEEGFCFLDKFTTTLNALSANDENRK
ncbi:hypothetical protein PVAND_008704 [Polypedilum vanderplanki]|uniref:Uncharacterized protein n=1 Tax=Polypedilum vanderplanki TaxID=319348 RepID=A0A9J6CB53_POLVA|nr:hypothetical protein PVAND_008704 [Polypedilum vanderplanki]